MPARRDVLERLRTEPAARAVLDAVAQRDGVHVIGGAVRDALLGGTPLDLDFAVEGDAAEVAAAVAEQIGGEVREHDRFGTARVTAAGRAYDFARTRRERYDRPGALPEVEPAPLADDLRRRDFTVNAIAVAAGGEEPGALVGALGALDDLEKRRLRVLHDGSFVDDPTRLLRLARYAARLDFEIEPHTRALAERAVADGAPATVSGPRLGQELRLALREDDPFGTFAALAALEVDHALQPGLRLDAALAERALDLLPADGSRAAVLLAAATVSLDGSARAALLLRLGFDRAEGAAALALDGARELVARLAGAGALSEIDALLAGRSVEDVALAGALGAPEQARRWLAEARDVTLSVSGDDLRRAGVREGPAIGAGLARARAARLDGQAHGPEEELAEALRGAGATQD